MSIAKILVYPDPILRAKAKEIDNIDDRIIRLSDDMVETMYAAPGIGLAAPQVGVSERLIVVDVRHPEGEKELITLVNPEIVEVEGEVIGEEGCLSVFCKRLEPIRTGTLTVKNGVVLTPMGIALVSPDAPYNEEIK